MNCIKDGKYTGDSCFGCPVKVSECEIRDKVYRKRWIPVEERLPENEKVVLICAERRLEKKVHKIISTAFYTDGTMWSEDSAYDWNDMDAYYDDEKDDFLIPEGWWEDTNYGEEFFVVDDFVVAWMPLPEPFTR